jgi:hypothetical protein
MNSVLWRTLLYALDRGGAAFDDQRLRLANGDFQAGGATHVDGVERADFAGLGAAWAAALAVVGAVVTGAQQRGAGDRQQQSDNSFRVHYDTSGTCNRCAQARLR